MRASAGWRIGRVGLLALGLALLVPPGARAASERGMPCGDRAVAPAAHQPPRLAAALLGRLECRLQAARVKRGLQTLRWQPMLAVTARRHAGRMVRQRYFSHVAPGGRDLRWRVRAAGYFPAQGPWWVGEVLAWGRNQGARPATVLARWLASPSHRRVILDPGACEIGVGVVLGAPVGARRHGRSATFVVHVGRRGSACTDSRTHRRA